MKALDWKRYLDGQAEQHGKRVFTLAELAHISGRSGAALNVELTRLRKSKLLERIARGIYAAPGRATLTDVLPWMDDRAYVTGAYVLYAQGFITQIPSEIICFTDRRHFQSVRVTSVGRLRFAVIKPPVYAPPSKGCLASSAQALCDLGWMADREGTDLRSLYTFRKLDRLRRELGPRRLGCYPLAVGALVRALCKNDGVNLHVSRKPAVSRESSRPFAHFAPSCG